MQDFVDNCFLEYKQYMDILNVQLPKVVAVPSEKDTSRPFKSSALAYFRGEEILQPIAPLYINAELHNSSEKFQKSILFHEFTHLFDANTKFKTYNDVDGYIFTSLMRTYSEYHASYIELGV